MAHIRIERTYDSHECDTCGFSMADGARILVDGELKAELIPVAHCFDGTSYEDEEIERAILEALGANVVYSTEGGYVCRLLESQGHVIEVVAEGAPPGLGEPVYGKLDAELASAMMGINAVKAVEVGAGFAAAALSGEDNADAFRMEAGPDGRRRVVFGSNNAGGILGGISTGQPIVVRFAVKPTSSILAPVQAVDLHGNEVEVATRGRHDPCVGIRAVPVGEAMMACVLADQVLRRRAQTPEAPDTPVLPRP